MSRRRRLPGRGAAATCLAHDAARTAFSHDYIWPHKGLYYTSRLWNGPAVDRGQVSLSVRAWEHGKVRAEAFRLIDDPGDPGEVEATIREAEAKAGLWTRAVYLDELVTMRTMTDDNTVAAPVRVWRHGDYRLVTVSVASESPYRGGAVVEFDDGRDYGPATRKVYSPRQDKASIARALAQGLSVPESAFEPLRYMEVDDLVEKWWSDGGDARALMILDEDIGEQLVVLREGPKDVKFVVAGYTKWRGTPVSLEETKDAIRDCLPPPRKARPTVADLPNTLCGDEMTDAEYGDDH